MYNFSLLNYRPNIPWLKSVKSILDECGLSYVWNNQYFVSATWLYNNVKQILIDQFKQIWHSNLQNSSKALNYRMFKEKLEIGKYFEKLDVRSIRLCRFRTRTIHYQLKRAGGKTLQEKIGNVYCVILVILETSFTTFFHVQNSMTTQSTY